AASREALSSFHSVNVSRNKLIIVLILTAKSPLCQMHGHFDDYDKIGNFTHLQGDRKNLNLSDSIL
ncbi:MAG: hypothetical protein ACRCZS_18340, partial [Chroococcidiopsis sp.]